ncbi:hypothetical protein [Methylobacterium haplocladii]|uniref:Uncharacterized protein n=1 Tax=Methylobacterium haplocladii TaxID=1176176 RepID=A0A512IU02_9HYPH|nr:hypothetical protein [Methylobacterium haplocladii]GEP01185.1 hypothetical protein MHA02_35720 [Methylobacterium haplocladii]GJD82856.1 hypothetical protein HPGCJGGD_0718 [Methylobacterium haplocladii]GLS58991.1 hypothetical protein GCM10007887_16570 [Methylobacterium haplocladii]
MKSHLIEQHITAMTVASTNLLRQMHDEGLRYSLDVRPDDTATMHVSVQGLTPDIEGRIRRCLLGTGMTIAVAEA